jgi:hypothetical protein
MRYWYVAVLIVASLMSGSPVLAFDVCSLVSRTEMSAAFGQAISSASPSGPDLDARSGSKTWTCTYGVAHGVLAVSMTEFGSSGAARNFVTLDNLKKELKDLEIQVTEEKNIGDRAFLFTDEGGFSLTALKGSRYLAVTAAQEKVEPDRLKASLRKIAMMLLPRL